MKTDQEKSVATSLSVPSSSSLKLTNHYQPKSKSDVSSLLRHCYGCSLLVFKCLKPGLFIASGDKHVNNLFLVRIFQTVIGPEGLPSVLNSYKETCPAVD